MSDIEYGIRNDLIAPLRDQNILSLPKCKSSTVARREVARTGTTNQLPIFLVKPELNSLPVNRGGDDENVTIPSDILEVEVGCGDNLPRAFSVSGYMIASTKNPQGYTFHTEVPAPTVQSSYFGLYWGELQTDTYRTEFDHNESISHNDQSVVDYQTMTRIHPCKILKKDDMKLPSMLEVLGLQVHFHENRLHHTKNRPAFRADRIILSWYVGDLMDRKTGPIKVSVKDYREYWKDGEFQSCTWSDINLNWGDKTKRPSDEIGEFITELEAPMHPLSVNFFDSKQDEMIFISQFN